MLMYCDMAKRVQNWIVDSTEVLFASFLSSWFITAIVVNLPERKLAKRTSVDRSTARDFTIPIMSEIREFTFHLGIFLLNDSVWDEKSFLSMTWEQRAWDYNRETWLKTSKRQPWIESDNGRIPELLLSFSSKAEYMWKVCHFSKCYSF